MKDFLYRCQGYAINQGYRDDSDDFGQYAAMRNLMSGASFIETLFIDYLRLTYGDLRFQKGTLKASSKHLPHYDKVASYGDYDTLDNLNHIDHFLLPILTKLEIKTYNLLLKEIPEYKIAKEIKRSVSTVLQIKKSIREKVKSIEGFNCYHHNPIRKSSSSKDAPRTHKRAKKVFK